MAPELRKEIILNALNEHGIMYTNEVMRKCNVSEITIRRDLTEMEAKGLLIRTHGGAVKSKATDALFTYDLKINKNRQSKESICRSAAKYIEDGDIIFIDCGSTLSLLTKFISKFGFLTVITNSLPIIAELINFTNIRLSLIGGEIANERQAVYGPVTQKNIEMYHADKAFVGADGVSLKNGLSSYDEKDAAITLRMMENSDEVFLLCDSSKIEKNSFIKFSPIEKVHHLITDSRIDPDKVKLYKDHGVDVIVEE